jgi:simple sugar transport system ATP-binding protein
MATSGNGLNLVPPAVALQGLSKRFGEVLANTAVNLQVERGTIHGIVGENGAGKSTAMNLLYGLYRPDEGQISVHGQAREWTSPADAIAAGIGMVHQHFMLAGPLSVLDNILLGAEPRCFGLIDRGSARKQLGVLSARYDLGLAWDRPVSQLPVGSQQRIEILKLLYRQADILILDEPTAVLTPQEVRGLFEHLKALREEGKTVFLVTHKLKEVMEVTDRVTVFRAGRVTGELETARTNPQELANLMVGRKVILDLEVSPGRPSQECAIEVSGLSLSASVHCRSTLTDLSFAVRRGEIVGIAGVDGNGQSELLQALLHPRDGRCRSVGTIRFMGQDVTNWSAARIRALGVAMIPEDRLHEGLLPQRPLVENFLLGLQNAREFNQAGWLRFRAVQTAVAQALEEYDVRPRKLALPAGKLSGGNQQKLIIAREFQRQPQALIAAQPTRGVDVGAIEFIHQRIIAARDRGAGVLLVSCELEEILSLSDRILVMYGGRIAAEYTRGQATEQELGLRMGGA